MSRRTIDGFEFARRVVVPKNSSVSCGVGAQMSVEGSGKYNAWNRRDRGRLSGTASSPVLGARSRICPPELVSIDELQGEESSSDPGIWFRLTKQNIRDYNI